MIIVLFTSSYPYDEIPQNNFFKQEIIYLSNNFDRVVLVPEVCGGTRYPVSPEVVVDESYAFTLSKKNRAYGNRRQTIFSPFLYKEIIAHPSLILHPHLLIRLLGFLNKAYTTQKWVCRFIKNERLDPSECIFYTYWFYNSTLGIGLSKKCYPDICLISRAHGYDLYNERNSHAYIPCRPQSFAVLDGLFPDSDAGTRYISNRYPEYAHLCETSRLGVADPGFITSHSKDGVLRIVSCSFLVPVKRVDLIVRGLSQAARLRPELRIEWHHFGKGPLKPVIECLAQENLPDNASAFFPGYPSLEYLLSFYKDNPVDIFVNVSESEGGTPVSIMEAISCGIPIVATAIGGNPEIVSEQNGKLLDPNPTPKEMASALLSIWDEPDLALEKRKQSRRIWQEKYNADQNFQSFVERLKFIRMKKLSIMLE